MLIDFCHPSVRPRVMADKVSMDGYDVTNLISADPQLKNRGFMCESFIRPPVNITVKFPCNISIYRIVINPVIGRQQSCDMKVFTAMAPATDSWLFGSKDNDKIVTDGIFFNFVGNVSQQTPNVVCFQNASFHERNIWRTEDLPSLDSYPITAQLMSRKPGALSNVSHVSVSVKRTKNGGAVAVRRLEIWGIPSVKLAYDKQLILQKCFNFGQRTMPVSNASANKTTAPGAEYEALQQQKFRGKESAFVEHEKSDIAANQKTTVCDEEGIPEDFLDQLTYEVMAVPMLLPCGKYVDQSTLERFVNIEASWGRAPSDPFTSVAFSSGKNAVPDPILKSRIDDFLSKQTQLTVARTLGTSASERFDVPKFKSSRLVDTRKFIKSSTPPPPPEDDTDIPVDCLKDRSGALTSDENVAISYAPRARKRKLPMDSPLANDTLLERCEDKASFGRNSLGDINTNVHIKKRSLDILECVPDDIEEKEELSAFNYVRKSASPEEKQLKLIGRQETGISESTDMLKLSSKPVLSHSDSLACSLETALNSALANRPKFSTVTTKKSPPLLSGKDRYSFQPISFQNRNTSQPMSAKNVNTSKGELGNIGIVAQPVVTKDAGIFSPVMEKDMTRRCCTCEVHCKPTLVTYRLPCNHLMCRNCLRRHHTTNITCSICGSESTSREIIRVFN